MLILLRIIVISGLLLGVLPVGANAQTPTTQTGFQNPLGIPDLNRVIPTATDASGVSASIRILVLLTVLTLIPSILVMTTAFPRVIVVLALLRQAVGIPQLPPSQVLLALSLFVTVLVMTPTWQRIHADALGPYLDSKLGQEQAMIVASDHLKDFMYRQIVQADNDEDVYLFLSYSQNREVPEDEQIELAQVPLSVIVPAFMLSELKTAFIMGFRVYLPFLVIDMVIATILLSMGMMMLPPVLISLPFKLLLFVLADGWHLVVETLLRSFV
jgi:flagellar biosynthetic protein FliP